MQVNKKTLLDLLKLQDTVKWNTWRELNPELTKIDLSSVDLRYLRLSPTEVCTDKPEETGEVFYANLAGVNLRDSDLGECQIPYANLRLTDLSNSIFEKAQLTQADLRDANLRKANFRKADLWKANFSGAELTETNFSEAHLSEANFTESILSRAFLFRTDLTEANFTHANLTGANLCGAWLTQANFCGADLRGADLISVHAGGADFTEANLTGACIENWNPDSETKLGQVICDHMYRKANQQERRPSSGKFSPGEFQALFQQAIETVDLIFVDGIDWKAFFRSFQELRSEYDNNISIQAIEKKSDGTFVIRLEVPPEAAKAAIESKAKALYERDRQILEAQYRERLNAKDAQIEIYKKQSSSMEEIAKLLATRPIQLKEQKVSLLPNQIKVLQAVHDGVNYSFKMPDTTGLSLDMVLYYIESLKDESYLECAEWHDGLSARKNYNCRLTNKGKVALEDPDHLLPDKGSISVHQTFNNDLRGSNIINFANQVRDSASQNASQFSQTMGQNADEIARLITALREQAQQFPEEQRDNALMDLDDLQRDIQIPENIEPKRIKRRIVALLTVAGIIGGNIATATDFTNNVFELADKFGVPRSELLQHIPTHNLPLNHP